MSYVVIRGCSKNVNIVALNRWFGQQCSMGPRQVMAMVERLRAGHRFTAYLGEPSAQRLMRRAEQWGLTGITLHADDDLSEYPPRPGIWRRGWWRLLDWYKGGVGG